MRKTQGVKDLVFEVVDSLPESKRGPHVIKHVFEEIANRPEWCARYKQECDAIGRDWIVNNAIGKWTIDCVGHVGTKRQVALNNCCIAKSYSVLE